jgi:hypothetical protein
MSQRDDIIFRASLMHAEDVLEDLDIPVEEEVERDSEFRDWMRYNVAMTGRIPLMDEERNKD